MRSSAAQKKQARRADINRKARKDDRRAEARERNDRRAAPKPPALTPVQAAQVRDARAQLAATRAAVIEDARVARRLAKLVPEVRRRFTRELGKDGFALTLHNDIIEVRVTDGPTCGIRVNADGVPSPLVWLGTRRDEHAPLRYETYLGDWATFDIRPGVRHLAKGTVTGRMSSSGPPIRNLLARELADAPADVRALLDRDACGDIGGVVVVDLATEPAGYPHLLDLVHRREPATILVIGGDTDLASDLQGILDGGDLGSSGVTVKPFDICDILGRDGAITVDDNGAVSVDCRSDEG